MSEKNDCGSGGNFLQEHPETCPTVILGLRKIAGKQSAIGRYDVVPAHHRSP